MVFICLQSLDLFQDWLIGLHNISSKSQGLSVLLLCHPLTLCLGHPERPTGEMGQFTSLRALMLFQCVTGLGTGLLLLAGDAFGSWAGRLAVAPLWAAGCGAEDVGPWASVVKTPSFLLPWCTSRKHFLSLPCKIKTWQRVPPERADRAFCQSRMETKETEVNDLEETCENSFYTKGETRSRLI